MTGRASRRCIVVLGMHRSGTSAVARGLQVLGVDLGDNLMPPVPGDNEKGFFEDMEIVNINEEVLRALGSHWASLSPIPVESFDGEVLEPLKKRAEELLQARTASGLFGFKDPRTARLLPFWQVVFHRMGVIPSYVIVLRNPLSVAESLHRRDGFDHEKSHYLWLLYCIPAFLGTVGAARIVVDYDMLMEEPGLQLERIATALGLTFSPHSPETGEYIDDFLEDGLRRTHFTLQALGTDPAVPGPVVEAYEVSAELARDDTGIDNPKIQRTFEVLKEACDLHGPALRYMDRLQTEAIHARDQLNTLRRSLAERDGQIADLGSSIAERDNRIADLRDSLVDRDGQISALEQLLAERDESIVERSEMLAELEERIANLHETELRRIEALRTIEDIRSSTSWRVTAPLRALSSGLQNGLAISRLLPKIVKVGGGVVSSGRKACRVVLQEGWVGVKRRILFVAGNRGGSVNSMTRLDQVPAMVNRNNYAEWVRCYDTLTDTIREAMKRRAENFCYKPLISVIMPVHNPEPKWLREAIESVCKQIYPHWELCIADDASTDARICPILESYSARDPRIKVVFRGENGHISAASNSALELAQGEWIALLDHDDVVAEQALFRVAEAINQYPEVRLIYSDEDKIDQEGKRFDPYFKCDFNRDLFYSHNMVSHLGVYHAELLSQAGGFKEGMEGSQDYDLALRCIERIEQRQIHHIPRVLYHWRMHENSTALNGNAKPYAMISAQRALRDHFQRQGEKARVEILPFGYRVHHQMPEPSPLVSLIIPTRNGLELLQGCISSILEKTRYGNYEILIVDNGSDDPAVGNYFKNLQSDPRIRVLHDDRPFNYSELNNAAVNHARGEIIGLLNNDLEVITPEWLSEMVSHVVRPEVGAVGARLWYPSETLQHGGVVLGLGGVAGHAHNGMPRGHLGYFGRAALVQNFSAVTGASLLVRKDVYQEVGGLNGKHLPVAFNDVDFCLRLQERGYRNVWTPYAELYHHESASRGYDDTLEKQQRFEKEAGYMKQRWGDLLLNDPAYSPNLALDRSDFSLAWPPRVEMT